MKTLIISNFKRLSLAAAIALSSLPLRAEATKDTGGAEGPALIGTELSAEKADQKIDRMVQNAVRMMPEAWTKISQLVGAELKLPGITRLMSLPERYYRSMDYRDLADKLRDSNLPERDPELFALLVRLTQPQAGGGRTIFNSLEKHNLKIEMQESCPGDRIAFTQVGVFGAPICVSRSKIRQFAVIGSEPQIQNHLVAILSHEIGHHAQSVAEDSSAEDLERLERVAQRLQVFVVDYIHQHDDLNLVPKMKVNDDVWAYTNFSVPVDIKTVDENQPMQLKVNSSRSWKRACNDGQGLCPKLIEISIQDVSGSYRTDFEKFAPLVRHALHAPQQRLGRGLNRKQLIIASKGHENACPMEGAKIELFQNDKLIAEATWKLVNEDGYWTSERNRRCLAIFYFYDADASALKN